jgi:hypothetical protein
MSRKHKALSYSTYSVQHNVTLKWHPIVFVRIIQSQRIVTVTVKHGTATARLRDCRVFPGPTHTESGLMSVNLNSHDTEQRL